MKDRMRISDRDKKLVRWRNDSSRKEKYPDMRHRNRKRAVQGKIRDSPVRRKHMPDYGIYILSREEAAKLCAEYAIIDFAVSLLFYRSWIPFILLLPGVFIYIRYRRRELLEERFSKMRREFLDGIQFAGTALQSGYAMENAFSEALEELGKIYDNDAFIINEFRYITIQVRMNVPLEGLLESLGDRSHIDDIRNFSDVFTTARRTGGDMIAIVRNTIADMRQKEDTRQEIETVLSGKKMEQQMMSIIPLAILAYVGLTGPSFLAGLYHTWAGICIMTACLVVYLAAFLWGKKIMNIQVR